LTDEDMEIVVEKAIISKKCSKLHLQTNKITSKGALTIALGLQNNIALQKRWLDSNSISDIGVHSLAKILSENNSSLKMLGLNSNSITDEGVKHFAEMLKINKILTLLRLTHNSLTDQRAQYLANALTHHNNILESIDLSSNKFITNLSIDYLVQMIIHNQRLSSLSLSNCGLSEDGKQRFRSMGQAKYGFKLSL
jgi:Ran GTPase-activating protein (RanGAP) involved in mRNA processing and transport